MTLLTIPVAGYGSSPDIGTFAYRCVADVAEVFGFGIAPNLGVLDLDEITNDGIFTDLGIAADMGKRSNLGSVAY
jgi:hypothetical protein